MIPKKAIILIILFILVIALLLLFGVDIPFLEFASQGNANPSAPPGVIS